MSPKSEETALPISHLPEYTTIFGQCFSPDGSVLAASSKSGRVAGFDLAKIVQGSRDSNAEESETTNNAKADDYQDPNRIRKSIVASAKVTSKPILSTVSSNEHLILGSVGEIFAISWSSFLKGNCEIAWRLEIPAANAAAMHTDVNDIVVDEKPYTAGQLAMAGGDDVVRIFDIETRQEISTLKGHKNYVHRISCCQSTGTFASASEDGTVRLWDPKQSRPNVHTLTPSEQDSLNRPKLGSWIGAVDMTSDWLACGGGPRASLWHLRTLSPNGALPPLENAGVHEMKIASGRVIIGGQTNKLFQTNLSGELIAEVEVSSSCIYSVVCQESPIQLLAAAGSSSRIDICSPNFAYKDQTINLPL